MIPLDGAGLWFVTQAHPSAHTAIGVDGCSAADGQKDEQDMELFFAGALTRKGWVEIKAC
jgi:hypothetical protein